MTRPREFSINTGGPLAQGLVFAGLGRHTHTNYFHDSSLYCNHGRLTNMDPSTDWVWVPELGRWANRWSNVNGRVISLPVIPFASAGTFTAWVNWSDLLSSALVFDQRNDGSNVLQFGIFVSSSFYWGWYTAGNNYQFSNTAANYGIVAGAWNCFSLTWDDSANQTYLYKNGSLLDSKTDALVTYVPTVGGFLGDLNASGGYAMQGMVADFCYHNRVLSGTEIVRLADPSNVMLDGLILPPRRRIFRGVAVPPAGNRRRRFLMVGADT